MEFQKKLTKRLKKVIFNFRICVTFAYIILFFFFLIYIWNFHVSSNLLFYYICELQVDPAFEELHVNIEKRLSFKNIIENVKEGRKDSLKQYEHDHVTDILGTFEYKNTSKITKKDKTKPPDPDQRKGESQTNYDSFAEYAMNTHGCKGKLLMIYIWNFHVLSHLLLNYICKLHWNYAMNTHRCEAPRPTTAGASIARIAQVHYLWFYIWNFPCLK
jgi:hypothetical protein